MNRIKNGPFKNATFKFREDSIEMWFHLGFLKSKQIKLVFTYYKNKYGEFELSGVGRFAIEEDRVEILESYSIQDCKDISCAMELYCAIIENIQDREIRCGEESNSSNTEIIKLKYSNSIIEIKGNNNEKEN